MKVVLISIGTRGDMAPFLGLGELLNSRGCEVICAFPEQYRDLAVVSNLGFRSLGSRYIDLLDGDIGKAAMGGSGSGLRKLAAYIKLALRQTEVNRELVQQQYELIKTEKPDRIAFNSKVIYPVIWGLKRRGSTTLISPVPYLHYVKSNTHVVFNSNYGPFINKLTYALADLGLITTARIAAKWLKMSKEISRRQIKCALRSTRVIYTISPALFPRPEYWPVNLKVLGYQESTGNIRRNPGQDIEEFLNKHIKILFITFGSMTNPRPEEKTRILVEILQRNNIPAIINTASGGLVKLNNYDTGLIHFVSGIPYNWIFPRTYAVIHHGGSGTAHLALKYGCASLIIPHIIDQFVWDRIVFKTGVGPKGIKINRISRKNLEPRILELLHNPSYKQKAQEMADKMAVEDFREEIYHTITQ